MRYAFTTLLLLLWVGPALSAQTVRGRLVSATSGDPIAGGLILLADTSGLELGRTATAADGGFALRAPAGGTYLLRALRIGYHSWTSPRFTLASTETREYRIAMPEIAVQLEAVLVEAESHCRIRPERGAATAVLWEEAKKVLSVTELTLRQRLFQFRTERFDRLLSPNLQVTSEGRAVSVGVSDWPVRSLPAESLARVGYVEDDGHDTLTYYAPDITVLFSDAFLNRHCFWTRGLPVPDSARVALVGLAFEPVRGTTLPDIEGVLWLNRQTAELRSLEYSYTNLSSWVPPKRAGGRLEFERLPTGAWIVRKWWIRAPVAGVAVPNRTYFLYGFKDHGGEVVEVLTADGRPLPSSRAEPSKKPRP